MSGRFHLLAPAPPSGTVTSRAPSSPIAAAAWNRPSSRQGRRRPLDLDLRRGSEPDGEVVAGVRFQGPLLEVDQAHVSLEFAGSPGEGMVRGALAYRIPAGVTEFKAGWVADGHRAHEALSDGVAVASCTGCGSSGRATAAARPAPLPLVGGRAAGVVSCRALSLCLTQTTATKARCCGGTWKAPTNLPILAEAADLPGSGAARPGRRPPRADERDG